MKLNENLKTNDNIGYFGFIIGFIILTYMEDSHKKKEKTTGLKIMKNIY